MDESTIQQMREMYEEGASLRKVGAAFGVSGTRVQQIFARHNIPRRDRGGTRTGLPARKTNAIVRDYLDGIDRHEVAATHGVSLAEVHRVLKANVTREQMRERNRFYAMRQERAYDDWELSAALIDCAAELGPKFSATDYADWRDAQARDYPSVSLYGQRHPQGKSATWNEWRQAAGLPANTGSSPGHGRQYSNDAICEALDRVSGRVGSFPTLSEYDLNRDPGSPKASTIRTRYGRWSDVKAAYDKWKGSAG